MTTLIIYAHPLHSGHNATSLAKIEEELKKKNEKYEVLDLYEMKYDPVLHAEELAKDGASPISRKIQEKIHNSDKLIFIYPIWWNNTPAILKGFLDKIFSAGFGFKYVKKYGTHMPEGLLKGKRAAVFTTGGGPELYFKLLGGARGSKIVVNDTLSFCGIKSKGFHYGKALKLNNDSDKKLERHVHNGIKWLYN